jgi:hypothetical protein
VKGGELGHGWSLLPRAMGGRGPCVRTEERRGWRGGREKKRAGAAIYRVKLWTCQLAAAGGRCYSDDLGLRVLVFSACLRILVTAQNIFLDLHSTIVVQNLG